MLAQGSIQARGILTSRVKEHPDCSRAVALLAACAQTLSAISSCLLKSHSTRDLEHRGDGSTRTVNRMWELRSLGVFVSDNMGTSQIRVHALLDLPDIWEFITRRYEGKV